MDALCMMTHAGTTKYHISVFEPVIGNDEGGAESIKVLLSPDT